MSCKYSTVRTTFYPIELDKVKDGLFGIYLKTGDYH